MGKELIIFDFFGVISSEVFPIWAKKYFSSNEIKIIRKEVMEKSDKGIITEKEMFDQLSKRTGENSQNILNDWLETAVINSEMITLIIELRKKYKIALLSNAQGEFLNRILKRIDTDKVFDFMIISSEEKIAKPDKKIFELLLSKMKIKAYNSIFIDDNIINVDAAKGIGIDAILFKNVEQLKEMLLLHNIYFKDMQTNLS